MAQPDTAEKHIGSQQEVADFLKRAQAKLNEASGGIFFRTNNARLLPSFDRGSGDDKDADQKDSREGKDILFAAMNPECSYNIILSIALFPPQEFKLGETLGRGAFCEVKEITAITLKRPKDAKDPFASSLILPLHRHTNNSDRDTTNTDEADFPTNLFKNKDEIREYMSENFMRKDDDCLGKHPRYALKQVKMINMKQVETGLIDLSLEAKFLSCMNHPNIIKLRGVAGEPLSPNFGLVLDRLYMTLKDQMNAWAAEKKISNGTGLCACLFGSVDTHAISSIIFSATTVAYDLSRALRHIHSLK